MKNNRCKKAFTLIELLVVVLIIGILAAIALPQYQKAVRKARLAEMQSILSSMEPAVVEWRYSNSLPTGVDDSIDLMDQLSVDFNWPVTVDFWRCNPQKKLCVEARAAWWGVALSVGSYEVVGNLDGDFDYQLRIELDQYGNKQRYYTYCTGNVDLTKYGLEAFGFEDDGC